MEEDLMTIAPDQIKLFYFPEDRLRATINDEYSVVTVKPAWSAPLSLPNQYLALLNGKGDEITTISEPKELSKESLEAVQEELRRRYLTAVVETITAAKSDFGVTYWHVETNRGDRDFVTQNLQENAQWLSPTHLLLLDVDGNRFEIKDVSKLDESSQKILETVL